MPGANKEESNVKGPASYFPLIEEQSGHLISYWKQAVRASQHSRHKELVEQLKDEHGMGHGHANAIVADTLSEDAD